MLSKNIKKGCEGCTVRGNNATCTFPCYKKSESQTLKNKIAQVVHAQWSIWQSYQDKNKIQNNARTVEFTNGTWENWNRKANIRYQDLTEEEQKSDLEIAEKLWIPLFASWLEQKKQQYISYMPQAKKDGLEEALKEDIRVIEELIADAAI